jgi:hypothetical protein
MLAFEVYVNKVKVCTAGVENFDAVVSSLFWGVNQDGAPDDQKLMFSVSGLADKKYFSWVHYNMYVGSRVEIRIIDTTKVDAPKRVDCAGGTCST